MRSFRKEDEESRKINMSFIQTKDFNYYFSKDNLWNEYSKLSPKYQRFSSQNIDPSQTFKKTVLDIDQVEHTQKMENFRKT
jgi:hypothetical protein